LTLFQKVHKLFTIQATELTKVSGLHSFDSKAARLKALATVTMQTQLLPPQQIEKETFRYSELTVAYLPAEMSA